MTNSLWRQPVLQISRLNRMANHIHECGGPEQHPLKAMGLTRIYSIALAAIEAASIIHSCFWRLPINLAKKSFNSFHAVILRAKGVQIPRIRSSLVENILATAKIIAGFAFTLFFGIVFSPEINFRLHQKLGLVVDNARARKEKALKAKVEMEAKNEAIRRDRAERLAQFQQERQAIRTREDIEEDNVDADLARLFVSYETK